MLPAQLASVLETNIYDLDYAKNYLKRRFTSPVCWEIGSIWSVEVHELSGLTGTLISATCTGQTDEQVSGPQRLVREYLDRVGKGESVESHNLLSSRWRSSPEFEEFETKLADFDLSDYRRYGKDVRCLSAVKVERPNRTELQSGAGCWLRLKDTWIFPLFDVVRNRRTKTWEIDGILIE